MKTSQFPKGFWYWSENEDTSHGPFTSEDQAKRDAEAHSKTGHFQVGASVLPLPVQQLAPPVGMGRAEFVEVCGDCFELIREISREEIPTKEALLARLPSLMKAVKAFARQTSIL